MTQLRVRAITHQHLTPQGVKAPEQLRLGLDPLHVEDNNFEGRAISLV